MKKTNALRKLDQAKMEYELFAYDTLGEHWDGIRVAKAIGAEPREVFKTLVVTGKSPVVCMIPVDQELDLKKVATAVGEKSVSMLPLKELFQTTGYVQGGCSPIGMKKDFPVLIDLSAEQLEEITCSAGVVGLQMRVNKTKLVEYRHIKSVDLVK